MAPTAGVLRVIEAMRSRLQNGTDEVNLSYTDLAELIDREMAEELAWEMDAKRELVDMLRKILGWAEHPAFPPPEGHTCGPEGNCDCECMAWGYFQQDSSKARALLTKHERKD